MKTSLAAPIVATLLAAAFSAPAHAQTGRPSEAPRDPAADIVPADEEAGSYARYLMLNGVRRDEALKAARNIDRPVPSKHVAPNGASPIAGAASGAIGASGVITSR